MNPLPVYTPQVGRSSSTPFKPKSVFCPIVQNSTLNTFEKKVNYEVDNLLSKINNKCIHNLTRAERDALKELSDNKNIVIKRADKGGAVVVWGLEQYTNEANRQLQDTTFYLPLINNPMESLIQELKLLLYKAKEDNLISEPELKFLFHSNPRLASFYLLPKVHKNLTNPPGRPVISGNESLTEPISKYVDFFIKPLLPTLPAYIQDTTEVLSKIKENNFVGSNVLLVTMDVEALYTNIEHEQGLSALRHFLDKRPYPHEPPTGFLADLTDFTLNNNVFLFQDKLYKQMKGCAMGACFSPSYAGLFMGKWEEDVVFNVNNIFLDKIIWWARYIDDIILWWNGTEEELISFHGYLNNANTNVRLSLEYHKDKINFLDIEISKDDNGYLHTSLFRKNIHKNTILHANSFHSTTLINNIPFGQFQRLRRICDDDNDFNLKGREMYSRFRERGYAPKVLDIALSKANSLERHALLIRKPLLTAKKDRIYFSTRFSTEAFSIRNIIRKNWGLIQCDDTLREVFPDPPIFTFKKAPTLGDKLVHSHLLAKERDTWLPRVPNGTFKCGHCKQCDIVIKSKGFTNPVTQKFYSTNHFINCKTTHVIYILLCSLCNAFYVGRTKRRLQDRLAEHKYAVKINNFDYAIVKHFNDAHKGRSVSFSALGIEHVPLNIRRGDREKILNQKESRWIYNLKAMKFPGLNDSIDMVSFL